MKDLQRVLESQLRLRLLLRLLSLVAVQVLIDDLNQVQEHLSLLGHLFDLVFMQIVRGFLFLQGVRELLGSLFHELFLDLHFLELLLHLLQVGLFETQFFIQQFHLF